MKTSGRMSRDLGGCQRLLNSIRSKKKPNRRPMVTKKSRKLRLFNDNVQKEVRHRESQKTFEPHTFSLKNRDDSNHHRSLQRATVNGLLKRAQFLLNAVVLGGRNTNGAM
jgi:hypothetical protein